MNLEHILASSIPRQWVTRQAIVLDWNEGPRNGVCSLAEPGCDFFFHLFAESAEEDLLGIRLYAVSELQAGTVAQIEALLRPLGQPVGPLWIPAWKSVEPAARREIEGRLDALLVAARPTSLLTATADWLHFEGCWNADRLAGMQTRSSEK